MWITPSLRVTGTFSAHRIPATFCAHPAEAYDIIKSGHIAEVATLDDARTVMAMLGMDDEQMDDRIHFALTGEVLSDR
jgi:hypothetical protein